MCILQANMSAYAGDQRAVATNYPRGITSEVWKNHPLGLSIWVNLYLEFDGLKFVIDTSNMDSILNQVLSFPPNPPPAVPLSDKDYDKQIRAVVQVLNATSAKKLTGGVATGEDLLEVGKT